MQPDGVGLVFQGFHLILSVNTCVYVSCCADVCHFFVFFRCGFRFFFHFFSLLVRGSFVSHFSHFFLIVVSFFLFGGFIELTGGESS